MEVVRYWLPRAMGLLSLVWFAITAAPTFYWLESADLAAAGTAMATPAASAEPLYMMLVKVASLLPIGELAFRANFVSAFCAAIAVGGAVRLVLVLGREDWGTAIGAACTGALLATSFLFARHATVAEVYAPTAALIVVALLLFERVASGGNARVGLSLAWVAGLGFGFHHEYRMLLGLPIVALLCLRAYRGAKWPLLAPTMTIFAAVASHLYLPVRAGASSAIAGWSAPSTLAATWAQADGSLPSSLAGHARPRLGADSYEFFLQVLSYVGVVAVVAAFAGCLVLMAEKRTRWVGAAVLSILAFDAYYSAGLHPVGLSHLQNGVPLVLAMAVGVGVAVAALSRLAGPGTPFVGAVASIVLLVSPAMSSFSPLLGDGDLPRDYSEHALGDTPQGGLVVAQRPSLAGGMGFLQVVEGARPDVAALRVEDLADDEFVAAVLRASGREGAAGVPWNEGARPVRWQPGRSAPPANLRLAPGLVVGALEPKEGGAKQPTRRQSHLLLPKSSDPAPRRVLADSLLYRGKAEAEAGRTENARALLQVVLELWPEHPALAED